jgi:hypothetical protein
MNEYLGILYRHLPGQFQAFLKWAYYQTFDEEDPDAINAEFAKQYIGSEERVSDLNESYHASGIPKMREEALQEYRVETGMNGLSDMSQGAFSLYALICEQNPDLVIETGVAHGLSTLVILTALEENGHGHLHSIDVPYQSSNSADHVDFVRERVKIRPSINEREGRSNTFLDDRDPGYIVPESLRDRWTLHLGRSQQILPKLMVQLNEPDIFLHDSDHTPPCQFFEYELAFEWLNESGMILSDDITDVFDSFVEWRPVTEAGQMAQNAGYIEI